MWRSTGDAPACAADDEGEAQGSGSASVGIRTPGWASGRPGRHRTARGWPPSAAWACAVCRQWKTTWTSAPAPQTRSWDSLRWLYFVVSTPAAAAASALRRNALQSLIRTLHKWHWAEHLMDISGWARSPQLFMSTPERIGPVPLPFSQLQLSAERGSGASWEPRPGSDWRRRVRGGWMNAGKLRSAREGRRRSYCLNEAKIKFNMKGKNNSRINDGVCKSTKN